MPFAAHQPFTITKTQCAIVRWVWTRFRSTAAPCRLSGKPRCLLRIVLVSDRLRHINNTLPSHRRLLQRVEGSSLFLSSHQAESPLRRTGPGCRPSLPRDAPFQRPSAQPLGRQRSHRISHANFSVGTLLACPSFRLSIAVVGDGWKLLWPQTLRATQTPN